MFIEARDPPRARTNLATVAWMRPRCPRFARARWLAALVVVALALLWPTRARAGTHAVIPPGQEPRIRALVDDSIEAATLTGELPIELDGGVDIRVDRDHFRVTLHPAPGTRVGALPQLLVFHPDASPQIAGELAPAVFIRCGEPGDERSCAADELDPWRALAASLARRRAQELAAIWRVEADGEPASEPRDEAPSQTRKHLTFDQVAVVALAVLGLALVALDWLTQRDRAHRPRGPELLALAVLLAAFVAATVTWTPLVPLHEHNSFVARSDCAADPSCLDDPIGAWNLSALNGYGLLLAAVPPSAAALSQLSLALSVLGLILLWALARQLMRLLERPELAPVAGLSAVLVLATHPVAWRLAGSGSFWPWSLNWTVAAALAGAWAATLSRAARASTLQRWAGALAWLVAAGCLALAVGGNFVLLTLGPALVLAPLCWAWPRQLARDHAVAIATATAIAATAIFALLAGVDYQAGLERVAGEGIAARWSWHGFVRGLPPLVLEPEVGTLAWAIPTLAALAWATPLAGRERVWLGLRVLAPLAWLAVVPSLFLLVAAGELIGSGYPVGFINHHWELWWSALAAGLGLAWIAASLDQRWPLPAPATWPTIARETLRWPIVLPLALALAAVVRNPRAEQGWTMATGSRLVERELLALDQAFTRLPAHDVLVIPPRLLEPMTDAPTQWDRIEVNFPVRAYRAAMRARALEPAEVVTLDRFEPDAYADEARVLVYVGTSLRSFQPHEIEAGAVPEALERVELTHLRQTHDLLVVDEFSLRGEQHPAISLRLAGDRTPELELGFYALERRQ